MDKPLGLVLDQSKSPMGGLVVKSSSGNAAKAGIAAGDTVIYASSFFGDELWPADKLVMGVFSTSGGGRGGSGGGWGHRMMLVDRQQRSRGAVEPW